MIEQAYLVNAAGQFVDEAGSLVPRGKETPVGHNVRLLLNWESIDMLRVETEYKKDEVPLPELPSVERGV